MSPEEVATQARLTPALTEAFLLACQGQGKREVAASLGISVGAAQVRLHRVGKRLREVERHQEAQAELDELLSLLESVLEKR